MVKPLTEEQIEEIRNARVGALENKYNSDAPNKSLRQRATEFVAPYEKAVSDFFGNPLENIEKNFKPKAREFDKYKKKNKGN